MTGKDTAMLCPGSFGGVLGMSMRCLLHRISNADMKPSRQSRLCRIQWSTVKHYLAVLSKMTTTLTTRLLSICVIRLVPVVEWWNTNVEHSLTTQPSEAIAAYWSQWVLHCSFPPRWVRRRGTHSEHPTLYDIRSVVLSLRYLGNACVRINMTCLSFARIDYREVPTSFRTRKCQNPIEQMWSSRSSSHLLRHHKIRSTRLTRWLISNYHML